MTCLCLVRHGQTDWNLEGRYQGQSDVPLNEHGWAQANALTRRLQHQEFAAIYASDLLRAKQTAEIIAALHDLPVIVEPRLREINQGDWEGQLVDVIKDRYATLWEQRLVDPASVRPPGGETVGEVAGRVYAALDDIALRYPAGTVLIASHGLSLATVLCKVRSIPVGQAYTVIPENAHPVWVTWQACIPSNGRG
jgi:broad specificity phosphatase PhoE